jgi:hypothetical protein
MGVGLIHPQNKLVEYGLAFVRNPSDQTKDILYASAMSIKTFETFTNTDLVTADLSSMMLSPVGHLEDTYHSYLTSTGDGRLFTLSKAPGWNLREIDTATAGIVSEHPITGLPNSQGPLVFWGGALWVFMMKVYDPQALQTDVYRVDMSTWEATKVTSVDFIVTAATVSTCAPVDVPK